MEGLRQAQLRQQVLADAQAARERSRRLCHFAAEQKAFFRSQVLLSVRERRLALVERFRMLAIDETIAD